MGLQPEDLAWSSSVTPTSSREEQLISLLRDLWTLFTSTPAEIAQQFGESRCTDDHARINYALELMDACIHVGLEDVEEVGSTDARSPT